MKKLRFFRCQHCGNIIVKIVDSKVPVMCCGEIMKELTPNTTDAAQEKHVPVVSVKNGMVNVKVGSVPHPMQAEHYITFVVLELENGYQIKYLNPNEAPEANFSVGDDNVVAVYEYCNLHGLWVKEL